MDHAPPDKLVGALVSGLAVLRYLQKARTGVGVTQVARDLSLTPSTCFNLLRTLVHEGLANFDTNTKTYTISLGVVSLAQGALDRDDHIRVLHPALQRLALKFDVAMNLWKVIGQDRVLLVDRAEPVSTVQISMRIGQRLPMFVGALGRCLAASSNLPRKELRSRFDRIRWARPIDFDTWLAEVEQVRQRGYAVDRGHFARGIITVSVALRDASDAPFLAISAIGISEQIDDDRLNGLAGEMLELVESARV